MDIVDEQQVCFSIAPPKLGAGTLDHGANELVHELLGSDVCDASVGTALEGLMRDSLHEVRFAESGITVDEERIVNSSRRLADGVCSRRSQLIRLPNHKKIERVALAQ